LHYKEFRIEFSIEEFEEFIDVIKNAADELGQYTKNNPRRFGKFQRACPNERVKKETMNEGQSFWTKPSDNDKDRPYESTYEEEDARLKGDTRETNNSKLMKLDVRDLFDITLFHSTNIHPWGCDENGVFLPLLNRYQFVKKFFESSELTEEEIKSTNYWSLLSKKITDKPRDGGGGWVYKDPMEQCRRLVNLIKSIKQYGYLGLEKGHESYREFQDMQEIIEADGKISLQKNKESGYPGLISVMPSSGAYKVHNGLHRIAILKYLWDTNQLDSPLILVRKWDDTSFDPSDVIDIKYNERGYPIGRPKSLPNITKRFLARIKNKIFRILRRLFSKIS